jgi:Ala-tRNA(Pro) deacylase
VPISGRNCSSQLRAAFQKTFARAPRGQFPFPPAPDCGTITVEKHSYSEEVAMPLSKVRTYLDGFHIPYVVIGHSPAYTALETAHLSHISGQELAKTVIVHVDGRMAMAVLPASAQIDFELFRSSIGADSVDLATEAELRDVFPDCELGAMPPFGNLYGMPVYVAELLTKQDEFAFNAGSHSVLFQMAYGDFERLVKPKVVRLAAGVAA